MYQKILIENQPVYIPMMTGISDYSLNSSTYFIRGLFSRGHYTTRSFYARLGELEIGGHIRHVTCISLNVCDYVFLFDAPDSLQIIKLFTRLNSACIYGCCHPLPDLEFVHPAAHALIYSLGVFSGGSADCYLNADPDAVDINQKVR